MNATLQDVSNLFCDGKAVYLLGCVEGRTPAQIKQRLNDCLRNYDDVDVLLLNSINQRLIELVESVAGQYKINVISGAGVSNHHKIELILPIGPMNEFSIQWAEKNNIEIWGA